MQTTLSLSRINAITQRSVTVAEAREFGLLDGVVWTENMAARATQETRIGIYYVDGLYAGAVWDEEANFTTLAEFIQGVDELTDFIWTDYRAEVEGWLDAQAVARL